MAFNNNLTILELFYKTIKKQYRNRFKNGLIEYEDQVETRT